MQTRVSPDPGWQAAVDGGPAEVLRVNGDFLGVLVEPGRHAVALQFAPLSLRLGKVFSCFSAGLLGLVLLGSWILPGSWKGGTRHVVQHVLRAGR